MNSLAKFFGGWVIAVIVVGLINLAILAGAVWVVVQVLKATGVL